MSMSLLCFRLEPTGTDPLVTVCSGIESLRIKNLSKLEENSRVYEQILAMQATNNHVYMQISTNNHV